MQINPIVIAIGGRELSFKVELVDDQDHGAPWEECDGHGPVSGWTRRDKLPGELLLNESHGDKRYYDFAEACRIALRDGWDHTASKPPSAPDCPDCACVQDGKCLCIPSKPSLQETPRQQAARAARADFECLRGWCNDEWRYVGVVVTLLNPDGTESDIQDSMWGIENFDDTFVMEQAHGLADEIAGGLGVKWGLQTREVYAMGEVETDGN